MGDLNPLSYNKDIEDLRQREYPMLKDSIYLDHAGTTLYAKSLIERFSSDMVANLFGNPHSASNASQLTTQRIEDVRLRLLGLFNADPSDFDVVFVANATAGIKLVMDAFRDQKEGFWYGYHRDAHTSLIGVREVASKHQCFESDHEVNVWIDESYGEERPGLFAYPAQSNMNGRRLPLKWLQQIRSSKKKAVYTLLDAAALVSTTPLDLADMECAPDFTVVSLYKIFGFPDLGALVVRKSAGHVFDRRQYFGGGTVEMVVCLREQWHATKSESLHERLEDGTLPIHSIVALDAAMNIHQELYGSLHQISKHTAFLAAKLYEDLSSLQHANGSRVCEIYKDEMSVYGDRTTQGPVVAFNLLNQLGGWVSTAEIEKLAAIKSIQLRTGGLCNPGGVAHALGLAPWEMKENFSAGQRCGNDNDIIRSKPTGMVRVSLGAMSSLEDVTSFVKFVREFFVQDTLPESTRQVIPFTTEPPTQSSLQVERISIYPIKSCAAWNVPRGKAWNVRPEGLAWDREWCLVHQGTTAALSQKRYPKMALIRPSLDLDGGVLRIRLVGTLQDVGSTDEITVPLSNDPRMFSDGIVYKEMNAKVCGESVGVKIYRSTEISSFFSQALGVACHLARFPPIGNGSRCMRSPRHSKDGLRKLQAADSMQIPGAFPDSRGLATGRLDPRPILLSNESPILTISRSSLNRLNELIKAEGGKAAQADVFRANIVIAENLEHPPGMEMPYAEDDWRLVQIGQQYFEMLGPCRRCQMVCVDQQTAERNSEPFVTLSKTRRFDGRVYFGEHSCHMTWKDESSPVAQNPTIGVGDTVRVFRNDEVEEENHVRCLMK